MKWCGLPTCGRRAAWAVSFAGHPSQTYTCGLHLNGYLRYFNQIKGRAFTVRPVSQEKRTMRLYEEHWSTGGGPCAKQVVRAVLVTRKGNVYEGTNWCKAPQKECPRKDLATGEGYERCVEVCHQRAHAEINAIHSAEAIEGHDLSGSVMVLFGHYYACEECLNEAAVHGVQIVVARKED